jgi:hypothetical protein
VRLFCDADADGPSVVGGAKIAAVMTRVVWKYESRWGNSEIYV